MKGADLSYSVHIGLLCDNSGEIEDVFVRCFGTHEAAADFIRRAIRLTGQLQEPMTFDVRDPMGRLLVSLTSREPFIYRLH